MDILDKTAQKFWNTYNAIATNLKPVVKSADSYLGNVATGKEFALKPKKGKRQSPPKK
jgi:hypothetical protein